MVKELEREVLWRSKDAKARKHLYAMNARKRRDQKAGMPRLHFSGNFGLASKVDQILVGTGVACAVAAAGFATIMISTDHSRPQFNGIEHLMLFAQPMRGRQGTVVARESERPAEDAGIDYSTTGSIRRPDPRPADEANVPSVRSPATEPIIMDYVLQEAQIGVAFVQGRGIAYRVTPGNFLPGAGRVLSVEQRDKKWVVVTTQGIIVDRATLPPAP